MTRSYKATVIVSFRQGVREVTSPIGASLHVHETEISEELFEKLMRDNGAEQFIEMAKDESRWHHTAIRSGVFHCAYPVERRTLKIGSFDGHFTVAR